MTYKRNMFAGWMVWLLWVLVSTAGFVMGIGVSLAALGAVGEIVSSIAFGTVTGLAQWLVLRRYLHNSGWWILATALGAPLGFAATNAVHKATLRLGAPTVYGVLGFVALGLVVGIAQWSVLRRHLCKAGWWVLASAVGWSVGGLVIRVIGLQLSEFIKIIADFAMIGVIAGASTGLALIFLSKNPVPLEARRVNLLRSLAIAGCALVLIITLSVRERDDRSLDNLGDVPDLGSVPTCNDLPPLDCVGSDTYCTEVVPFEPVTGPGYTNYPVSGETWDDQYRSYLGRDLMMMVKYASARVACESEGWGYRQSEPLGLGDMSEADGSIPGTSIGQPGHPQGTHQDGRDIDVAYYQEETQSAWLRLGNRWLGVEGDLLRPVCKYTIFGTDVYHCTEPPRLLDPWRTALFIAYLAEHPQLRVIGVDGQVGPVLEAALDQLVQAGWIDSDLRERVPVSYEVTYEGRGWFRYHHHHMHISMQSR